MANVSVPSIPGIWRWNRIRAGEPPSAADWKSAALMANYAIAHGNQFVPMCFPGAFIASSLSAKFKFFGYRSALSLAQEWRVTARLENPGTDILTLTLDSGAQVYLGISDQAQTFRVKDTFPPAVGRQTRHIVTQCPSPYTVIAIQCVDIPRALIGDQEAYSIVDPASFNAGFPIDASPYNPPGLSGFQRYIFRRTVPTSVTDWFPVRNHFSWAVPYQLDNVDDDTYAESTTALAGSPDTIFPLKIPVLGRAGEFVNATEEGGSLDVVYLRALYRTSDGSTAGRIDVSATNGDTRAITLGASTSYALSNAVTSDPIDIDAEDYDVSDGLRASAYDELTVTWHRTSGSGTVYLAGFYVYQ